MTTPSTPPESTRAALDPERVAELAALAKRASQGPRDVSLLLAEFTLPEGEKIAVTVPHPTDPTKVRAVAVCGEAAPENPDLLKLSIADAEFIAACSPDFILSLLTEYTRLQADAARLGELLETFVDDDECMLDHHGYCQTHTLGKPCNVAEARDFLAARAATPVEVPSNG